MPTTTAPAIPVAAPIAFSCRHCHYTTRNFAELVEHYHVTHQRWTIA
jgi:hypothetical protein